MFEILLKSIHLRNKLMETKPTEEKHKLDHQTFPRLIISNRGRRATN